MNVCVSAASVANSVELVEKSKDDVRCPQKCLLLLRNLFLHIMRLSTVAGIGRSVPMTSGGVADLGIWASHPDRSLLVQTDDHHRNPNINTEIIYLV